MFVPCRLGRERPLPVVVTKRGSSDSQPISRSGEAWQVPWSIKDPVAGGYSLLAYICPVVERALWHMKNADKEVSKSICSLLSRAAVCFMGHHAIQCQVPLRNLCTLGLYGISGADMESCTKSC